MDKLTEAIYQGLMLPLRFMFQPRATNYDLWESPPNMRKNRPSPILVYMCTALWGVMVAAFGVLILGMPDKDDTGIYIAPVALMGLSTFLGLWLPRRLRLYRLRGEMLRFDYPFAIAFGVILPIMYVVQELVGSYLARQDSVSVQAVQSNDDYTLLFVLIYGIAGGLAAAMIGGAHLPPRLLPILGVMLSLLLIGMVIVLRPSSGTGYTSVAFFGSIILFGSHLIYQPLWVLLNGLLAILARINPALSPNLWKLSPAAWNEYSYVRLPGIKLLLTTLYRTQGVTARRAINQLKRHPFYDLFAEEFAYELFSIRSTPE